MTAAEKVKRPQFDPEEARAGAADAAYDDGVNMPRRHRVREEVGS
jgi:hypothetical protein